MSAILAMYIAAMIHVDMPASARGHEIAVAARVENKRKPPRKRLKKKRRTTHPPFEEIAPSPEERQLLPPGDLHLPQPYVRPRRPDFPRGCISDLDCSIGASCGPLSGRCQ